MTIYDASDVKIWALGKSNEYKIKCVRSFAPTKELDFFSDVAFIPNKSKIAVAGDQGVEIRDIFDEDFYHFIPTNNIEQKVSSTVAVSPCGKYLAYGKYFGVEVFEIPA